MIDPIKNSAKIILTACLLVISGCGAESGATGPQGQTGVQGVVGPQGQAGVQGDVGPVGATGASSLWLSPSDLMIEDSQTWVTKTNVFMDGNKEVIRIEKDNTQLLGGVSALVPLPEGWDQATSVTMTTYYALSETGGGLNFNQGVAGFNVGEVITQWGYSPTESLIPAGDADTLYSNVTDITADISPEDEFLHIGFERYMLEGGDVSKGDDSNSGDVYIIAIKLKAEI